MNIGIGVLPYILLFFRIDYDGKLDAHSIPWVICLILSIITFLGLVIFRGRDLKTNWSRDCICDFIPSCREG